jgi:TM2 domain-containing membrane protein YozV
MLNQDEVDAQEEAIRLRVRALSDEKRKEYFRRFNQVVKDPDTYAGLNWLFIAGLHHFYLGRWGMGFLDLIVFTSGVFLLFTPLFILGIILIIGISLIELWALFRASVIAQDFNNQLALQILRELGED